MKDFYRHHSTKVAALCITTCTILALIFLSDAFHLKQLFSVNGTHRIQTLTLLQGILAPIDSVFCIRNDWAWGEHGAYPTWGLGIPILFTPFFAVAKAFGYATFPELVIFLLLYGTCTFLLLSAFTRLLHQFRHAHWLAACFVIPIMLSPSFLLSVARFNGIIYTQTTLYNSLWAILLFSLFIYGKDSPRISLAIILGLCAGFAAFVRPAGLFYGLATCGLYCFLQARFWPRALSLCAFTTPLLLHAYLNFLRFGDPFEIGHGLHSPSSNPFWIYTQSFRIGFQASWLEALRELFGSLFFTSTFNGHEGFQTDLFPGQSSSLRYREMFISYFNGFDCALLVLAVLCYGLLLWQCPKLRKRHEYTLLLWPFIAFVFLVLLYGKAPSITSRYWMDFFPAFSITIALVGISFFKLLSERKAFVCALTLGIVLLYAHSNLLQMLTKVPTDYETRPGVDYETAQKNIASYTQKCREQELPTYYTCPSSSSDLPRFIGDRLGWDYKKSCATGIATQVILPESRCISFLVDLPEQDWRHIQIRSNREEYIFTSSFEERASSRLTYCRAPWGPRSHAKVRRVVIGWIPPSALGKTMPDIRLREIGVSPIK